MPLVVWSLVDWSFMPRCMLCSNSSGVSMPSALWRRLRLWKISRYSKIAFASSTRVLQRRGLSSSTCIRDQNASIIALS